MGHCMFYPLLTCKILSHIHFIFFYVLLTDKPTITLRSSSPLVVNESDATSMVCVARGRPRPTVIWRYKSAIIQQRSYMTNYIISPVTKDHAGNYTCVAEFKAPPLGSFSTEYAVSVIVQCKSRSFIVPFTPAVLDIRV